MSVADFRGTREVVTEAAKCEGLLFHDLRRSAVRNIIWAGIPEVVAMRFSGHKTRAVSDRYNIVSERDLADAAKKLELSQSLAIVEQAEKPQAEQLEFSELERAEVAELADAQDLGTKFSTLQTQGQAQIQRPLAHRTSPDFIAPCESITHR